MLFLCTQNNDFAPKSTFLGNRSHNRSQLNFSVRLKLVRLSEKSDSGFQECRKNVPKLVRSSKKSDKSDLICHELKVALTQLKSKITEILFKWSRTPRPGWIVQWIKTCALTSAVLIQVGPEMISYMVLGIVLGTWTSGSTEDNVGNLLSSPLVKLHLPHTILRWIGVSARDPCSWNFKKETTIWLATDNVGANPKTMGTHQMFCHLSGQWFTRVAPAVSHDESLNAND